MKILILTLALMFAFGLQSIAQHEDERYVPETDPLALQKIGHWQDVKFGLLMHWGAYSQWGIVESWSICSEHEGWCERKDSKDYDAYKKKYEALQTTFNPVNFNPDKWAKAAKDAGMKYVIFTTKHHDGFCMFDTKYTDYKITSEKSPYHANPKANVTDEIFKAFRSEDFMIGAYFSKPDWHSEYYWWPEYATPDRNVNYDPAQYPERWEEFVQFTQNQVNELVSDYGKIDILWFDGGWVAKKSPEQIQKAYLSKLIGNNTGYLKSLIVNQDIRMDEIVANARKKQPGIIVVDRAVYGKNQNYLTPENRVPEKTLPYPWESCIIAGGGWSYSPNAKYMSGREGIKMLVDIVAKGGNLLLNIAPAPDGTWDQGAYDLLKEYGSWMKVNGEAIYNSKPLKPYKEGKVCMTQQNDGSKYFIYLSDEGEDTPPSKIWVSTIQPKTNEKVTLLGKKEALKWEKVGNGFVVEMPESVRKNAPCKYAWTIKVSSGK
jgi:alpha-L-fucosidase